MIKQSIYKKMDLSKTIDSVLSNKNLYTQLNDQESLTTQLRKNKQNQRLFYSRDQGEIKMSQRLNK